MARARGQSALHVLKLDERDRPRCECGQRARWAFATAADREFAARCDAHAAALLRTLAQAMENPDSLLSSGETPEAYARTLARRGLRPVV
ncbi:MAG TPA: hypothetical protein VJ247_09250 [Gaiella sp.]|jgi:hypothetical protein|nr:hypothetical protein [Gaiella sp.]